MSAARLVFDNAGAFLRLHLKNTFELGGANDARSLVLGATAEEQDAFVDVVMNGGAGAGRGSGAGGDEAGGGDDGRGQGGPGGGGEVDIAIIDQNVECNGVVRHRGIDLAGQLPSLQPLP